MPIARTRLRSLVLLLAGCAVGPDYVRPRVPLAPQWSARNDARLGKERADSAWWKLFNDPTLDQLVALAHQQNLPLQVAGLRIYEARAQLGIAIGQQFPQVQAAFANAKAIGISKEAGGAIPLDRRFWSYEAGFDAAWELDIWGKYRRGVSAEEANYFASVMDYQDALVSLIAEVARTYAVIRTFDVLVEQARQNVTLQEQGLQIADARFRNGATSELDVAQATTLLESTRASIPPLEASAEQARNALCTLLGRPAGCAATLLQGAPAIPTPPARVAVSVPAELLRRRPDIRGAELRAVAQTHRIGVAKADFYPRFTLFGTIGTSSSSVGDLFAPGSLFYTAGPGLFWPLLNYGRILNNVRVQDARLQQLLVGYQDTVVRAAQEVEDGMTGFLKSQEAVTSAQAAVTAAQRAVELALVQYREGSVDYQRVLDAQRSLLQEQQNLTRLRSSVVTNLIALYKALGGGWEVQEKRPVVTEQNLDEMRRRTNWGIFLPQPTRE